jgi:hypothetical protein
VLMDALDYVQSPKNLCVAGDRLEQRAKD